MIALVNSHAFRFPIAANRCHLVTFSPPYANGIRDYGTAKWVGGDENCKHQLPQDDKAGKKQKSNHGSMRTYKEICAKCGAVRNDEQLGQEAVIDCEGWMKGEACGRCYVCNLLTVSCEVWRVLHPLGMFVLNLGDVRIDGQPALVPSLVCLALRKAGWRLVHDNVWSKPNPMPESMKRRPTRSYEMVYMFAKSPDYFCDMEAVKEPSEGGTKHRRNFGAKKQQGTNRKDIGNQFDDSTTRNLRDVWSIPTHSYPGSHFATWPPELVNLIIKMCTSERGACPTCGNQWERVIEKGTAVPTQANEVKPYAAASATQGANGTTLHKVRESKTIGWQPTCNCQPHEPIPSLVLDPFCGSGTTLQEARRLGRSAIGCDLSMAYLQDCAIPRLQIKELAGEAIQGGGTFDDLPLFQGVKNV